jgi:putative methanogenesis marker protein 6
MTEYAPAGVGTVTRYVMVESFDVTPADLAIRAYEIAQGVIVKETCFGLAIMGKPEEVDRIIAELRKIDPAHIFVKDRGFPPGDARRCRSSLGGARPGFHGIEFEMTVIPYVSHGLEVLEKRDEKTVPEPKNSLEKPLLDVNILKKIIETQEP